MTSCPDCGSFDYSSEQQHGQALCSCASCGCQWWDDSEEQYKDKLREQDEKEALECARDAELDCENE